MNLLSILNQLMQNDNVDKDILSRLELAVETNDRTEILEILREVIKVGANLPTRIVNLLRIAIRELE